MNEYIIFIIYTFFGIVGAVGHYLKKRYKDKVICCDLWYYITNNVEATLYAVGSIAFFEMVLASNANADPLSLVSIIAALGVGFGSDSGFNKE